MSKTTYRHAVATISRMERLGSSRLGNPMYRVFFADGTSARTQTDASVVYAINNPEYQGVPVRICMTRHGQICDVEQIDNNTMPCGCAAVDCSCPTPAGTTIARRGR